LLCGCCKIPIDKKARLSAIYRWPLVEFAASQIATKDIFSGVENERAQTCSTPTRIGSLLSSYYVSINCRSVPPLRPYPETVTSSPQHLGKKKSSIITPKRRGGRGKKNKYGIMERNNHNNSTYSSDEEDDRKPPAAVNFVPSHIRGTNAAGGGVISSSSEDSISSESSGSSESSDEFNIKELEADIARYDKQLKLLAKEQGTGKNMENDEEEEDEGDKKEEEENEKEKEEEESKDPAASESFTSDPRKADNTKISGVLLEDDMWEVDDIHGYKDAEEETMWLISWVGDPKKTWEPDSYLSSSAKAAAEEFRAKKEARINKTNAGLYKDDHEDDDGVDDEEDFDDEQVFTARPAKKARKRPPATQRPKNKTQRVYSRSRSRPARQGTKKGTKSVEEKEMMAVAGSGKKQMWAVEKVLDYDIAKNKYRIRWQGCRNEEDDTWEPRKNLDPTIFKEATAMRELVMTKHREHESPLELNQSSPFADATGVFVKKMSLPVQQYVVGCAEEPQNFLRLFVQGQQIANLTFRFASSKFDNTQKPKTKFVENGKSKR
jgi:hypothetical protein